MTDKERKKLKTLVDKIFNATSEVRDEQTRYLKRYKGEWWKKEALDSSDSRIYANFVLSTIMTIAPMLTDNKPIWSARARKDFMQHYILAHSKGLEYLWDKLELDMKFFLWVLDALIMKIGILKVKYNPVEDEIEAGIEDPRHFFIAPGFTDIWDAPMCGVRKTMSLAEIRMNYENGNKVKPDNADPKVNYDSMSSFEWINEVATVYEVWFKDEEMENYYVSEQGEEIDKNDEGAQKKQRKKYPYARILTFAGDVELEDKQYEYKHGKPPWIGLYDYVIPHEFMGKGEVEDIEEITISFNTALQLMDKHMKNYCNPPWLLDSQAGIEHEKAKEAIAGNTDNLLEYNSGVSAEPFKRVESRPINASVGNYMSGLNKLKEEITAVTETSKGMASKAERQSATEIATLAESSNTRTRQRIRNAEHAVKRLLYVMLELQQQYYTEPRNISWRSDENVEWMKLSNSKEYAKNTIKGNAPEEDKTDEEIKKEADDYQAFMEEYGEVDEIYASFDIAIDTNSSLPMDKQSLANLFLRLLEMAAPNPATAIPMWEATLECLKIPKYKEIIESMKELMKKEEQAPMPGPASPMAQMMGG